MTPPNKISRRGFMVAITGSALAAAAGCRPEGMTVPTLYAPGSAPLGTPTPGPTAQPTTVAAQPDPAFGNVIYDEPVLTDVSKLYITQYDYNNTPSVDEDSYKLTVDGLVTTPLTLSLADLKGLPAFEEIRTMECISNPPGGNLIGNLVWRGASFADLLAQAQPKAEVTHVRFEAADGYSTSVKLEWMTQPGVMLAYEMNSQPLTVPHGFPLRLHIPGLYGQKMPRWLTRIEFIDYDYKGYWEGQGWSNIADVRTKSIIRLPTAVAGLISGAQVAIQGVAYAGKRKITSVEVQIDQGEWLPTTLVPGSSPLAWTQWYTLWTVPAPGFYQIGVRATDETGFVQTSEAKGIFGSSFPNGTDAIHRLSVQGK